jgi:hypothetical protein
MTLAISTAVYRQKVSRRDQDCARQYHTQTDSHNPPTETRSPLLDWLRPSHQKVCLHHSRRFEEISGLVFFGSDE